MLFIEASIFDIIVKFFKMIKLLLIVNFYNLIFKSLEILINY